MTVSEAGSRFKAAAPYAAAGGAVIAAVAGGALLMSQPGSAPASIPQEAVAANGAPPSPTPGGLAGVQFDQVPGGAAGGQLSMELVVKFKDDAKVKDIVDTFWKDQAAARAKFDAFKAGRSDLAGLKLDRVTYSNELVLVHDGNAPAERRLAAMREIAARLKSVADISYAEPNMTAHPGGQ